MDGMVTELRRERDEAKEEILALLLAKDAILSAKEALAESFAAEKEGLHSQIEGLMYQVESVTKERNLQRRQCGKGFLI